MGTPKISFQYVINIKIIDVEFPGGLVVKNSVLPWLWLRLLLWLRLDIWPQNFCMGSVWSKNKLLIRYFTLGGTKSLGSGVYFTLRAHLNSG